MTNITHISTVEAAKLIFEGCKDIYIKKMEDYGTSWRVMRLPSLTDQLFIKANRIKSIQESGLTLVGETIESDFMAIINYGITAIIQFNLNNDPDFDKTTLSLSSDKAIELYDKVIDELVGLMENKNHDYGEAWRMMRVTSMTDLILTKLLRIKHIEDNNGKTLNSEGVEGNYADIVNYSVFCIIKLTEENLQ